VHRSRPTNQAERAQVHRSRPTNQAERLNFALTIRKEILWESDTATDAEVRAKEVELILAIRANNPDIGYNRAPRFRE
jgi:hypothetical protein